MVRRDESNIPIWISIEMKSQFRENNVHGMKLLHDFVRGNISKGIDNCSGPWSLEKFIQAVKGQNNFGEQNAFLICSWRFLRSNKLEQLEFKLEKIIGI